MLMFNNYIIIYAHANPLLIIASQSHSLWVSKFTVVSWNWNLSTHHISDKTENTKMIPSEGCRTLQSNKFSEIWTPEC